MTEKNWKKKIITIVICIAAVICEAMIWERFVTTTLYGQARAMPEETKSSDEWIKEPSTDYASQENETKEAEKDPREEVWEHYKNLGVIRTNCTYVDIFSSPDSYSASVGKMLPGYGFEIDPSESNATWTKIQFKEHFGYVRSEYVASGEEAKEMALSYCINSVIPQIEQIPCYQEMSEDSAIIQTLAMGERYEWVEDGGDWVKLRIRSGVEGYVKKDQTLSGYYLESPIFYDNSGAISETRKDLINEAWKYYGGEYVWGGETLGEGVDCSGFVLRLYELFGIQLHRVSAEQAEDGVPINPSEMKPGDLIFYHGYRDGGITEGVGHVAMYMGKGKIIHAASEEKGICMDNWDYIPYITVRNVLGD